jgi:H+/Na+-translocating ferredoxin:NAD+ oxidoreductase subunit B
METADDPYRRLADALDRLPNRFPRTPSGVELRILRKICTPEEAALAGLLTGTPEPVAVIAERAGRPTAEVRPALFDLVRRGVAWPDRGAGGIRFRLAPFIVGIYEAQLDRMDHELAHLVEEYLVGGGARAIMQPQPALHRVMPTQATVKPEAILPYDDVRALLLAGSTFAAGDCICRAQQAEMGEPCSYPSRVCLSWSTAERPPRPGDLTRAEALELLAMTEEVGLVHTVSNVAEGVGYVCNCCGCCCGILRGITELGIDGSVARANYVAVVEPDLCAACGTCAGRCQVGAIRADDGTAVVDAARCIGCGLCASGCPNDAVRLERLPDSEIVDPPATFADWELRRLAGRAAEMATAAGD